MNSHSMGKAIHQTPGELRKCMVRKDIGGSLTVMDMSPRPVPSNDTKPEMLNILVFVKKGNPNEIFLN